MPTWKYLLKSLVSNITIIEGRKRPWYWAVMFFFLSICLMVTPVLALGFTNSGVSIISPESDKGLSMALYQLSQTDGFNNLYIENGVLCDKTATGEDKSFFNASDENSFFASTNLAESVTASGAGQVSYTTPKNKEYSFTTTISNGTSDLIVPLLNVFSTEIDPLNNQAAADELTKLIQEKIYRTDLEDTENRPTPRSFAIFTPSEMLFYMYSPLPASYPSSSEDTSTALPTAGSSNYTNFVGTFDRFDYFEFSSLKCEEPYSFSTSEDDNEFLRKWNPFISESYLTIRNNSVLIQFGIYAGATIGAIILCGLVIWLFTLGRRNLLYKDCSLWQGMKMAGTLSFTCALIGMILYFFNSSYGLVFAAMALVMRTMWLIMKTTGNSRTKDNKPLYQAR